MLPLNTELQASVAKDSIFDQRGLQAIRRMGPEQSPEALREVAKKFEAMFVQEMLKTMRASSELFAEGNYFSSETERFHRDMYDQQLSLDLTRGRGLGLADYFYQNMQQRYGSHLQGDDQQALAYTGDGSLQQAMASDGQLAAPVSYRPAPAINELLRKPGAVADSEQAQQAREENAVLNDYYLGISAPAKNISGQVYGATAQVHSAGGKQAVSQTQENFVAMLRPHAEQAARALNISPDVLIAQAALETGWGKHVIHTRGGDNSFNLFNIKSSGQWQGDSVAVSTLEYKGSAAYYERAGFRKYNSYSESFADYVRLIKTNARYQPALAAQDAPAYADALQRAGYATDPLYAHKIKRLLNTEPISLLGSGGLAGGGSLAKKAAQTLGQAAAALNPIHSRACRRLSKNRYWGDYMSGLLSNAVSGLQASQNALRTAGHNISNASTAGYSRQQVNYVTRPEQSLGAAGFVGSGVTTQSIERVVSEFVTTQLRSDTSTYNQLNSYSVNLTKVDKLLADASTGLSGSLQTFFAALEDGANDPASTSSRQYIIASANALSLTFNSLYERTAELEKNINTEIGTLVGRVSSLAQSVAQLNTAIAEQRSKGQGNNPNDLLDQRDEALRKLAELASIQVLTQDNGDVNIAFANGEPLVVGGQVSKLQTTNDGKIQLLSNNRYTLDIGSQIHGGQLGGLINFRDQVLLPTQNELGRIALVMADQFNTLQRQGIDLDGEYGAPMFSDINSPAAMANRVTYSGINAAGYDRELTLNIDNPQQMTTSDYRMEVIPGTSDYRIMRLNDAEWVAQGSLSGSFPQEIHFDGLSLSLNGGNFQGGDQFILQPSKTAARDIQSLLTRAEDLAFASPVRTGSNSGNSGSGIINAGQVLGVEDAEGNLLPTFATPGQLSPPLLIRFTSETTYDVLDNSDPANPKHLVPALREQQFVPGISNAIFSQDAGETLIVGNGSGLGLPAGSLAATIAPNASLSNQYPAEQWELLLRDPTTGALSSHLVTTAANASAAQTAAQLNSIAGVSASAHTTATLTNINLAASDFSPPTQLYINGEPLLPYDTSGTQFFHQVPNPATAGDEAFYDYLAMQINANPNLQILGMRAQLSSNPTTGAPELRLVASSGVDIDIRLTASATAGTYIDVNDSQGNANVRLQGANSGAGEQQAVVVGGRIDITLGSGNQLQTNPANSALLGDSSAASFAAAAYTGYQVAISGQPKAGDSFTIGFNSNAQNDNRNALLLTAAQRAKVVGGNQTLGDAYGKLVEVVATESSIAKLNSDASKTLLSQTQSMRDSISGVNLDEEAADLIRYQQLYQANARVITVTRELFDALLGAI